MDGQAKDVEGLVTAMVFGEVKATLHSRVQRNGVIAPENAVAIDSSATRCRPIKFVAMRSCMIMLTFASVEVRSAIGKP